MKICLFGVSGIAPGNHNLKDPRLDQAHKLVEALGERIAQAVLEKFDAAAVTVTVRKPKPIAGVLDYAGIRLTRTREDLAG